MTFHKKINPFLLNKLINFKLQDVKFEDGPKVSTAQGMEENNINANEHPGKCIKRIASNGSEFAKNINTPIDPMETTGAFRSNVESSKTFSSSQPIKQIRTQYTKQADKDLLKVVLAENGSTFGPGLASNAIWDRIHQRCSEIDSLENRSAYSLKFRFLQHIQPKLSVVSHSGETSFSPTKLIEKLDSKQHEAVKITKTTVNAEDVIERNEIRKDRKRDLKQLEKEDETCNRSIVKTPDTSISVEGVKIKKKVKKKKKSHEEKKTLKQRRKFSKSDDKEIERAVLKENGTCFGLALTKRKIWRKIMKRCHKIETLKIRSASSLKSRFFDHIQPKLKMNIGGTKTE